MAGVFSWCSPWFLEGASQFLDPSCGGFRCLFGKSLNSNCLRLTKGTCLSQAIWCFWLEITSTFWFTQIIHDLLMVLRSSPAFPMDFPRFSNDFWHRPGWKQVAPLLVHPSEPIRNHASQALFGCHPGRFGDACSYLPYIYVYACIYVYIIYIYSICTYVYVYIYVYPQPPGFAVNTILSSHLALCKGRCDRFTYVFLGWNRRCRVVVVMTFIRLRSFKCFFP